jgi:hypothetical protein
MKSMELFQTVEMCVKKIPGLRSHDIGYNTYKKNNSSSQFYRVSLINGIKMIQVVEEAKRSILG